MTTRSFLKSMLLIGVAPQLLLSTATDKSRWKRTLTGMWVPNPEYEMATYEVGYIMRTDCKHMIRFDKPLRMLWNDTKQDYVVIPPYVKDYEVRNLVVA